MVAINWLFLIIVTDTEVWGDFVFHGSSSRSNSFILTHPVPGAGERYKAAYLQELYSSYS